MFRLPTIVVTDVRAKRMKRNIRQTQGVVPHRRVFEIEAQTSTRASGWRSWFRCRRSPGWKSLSGTRHTKNQTDDCW